MKSFILLLLTPVLIILSQELENWFAFNVNVNGYQNAIDAFTVENKYTVPNTFSADRQEIFSGNAKLNTIFHLPNHRHMVSTRRAKPFPFLLRRGHQNHHPKR